ncbi:hypothetical protein UCRPA7_3362 [Phaeoacremonium minimum UCRPA7]|uniref:BTB domain-containing protein n=1 Tax=Phaeoacremonium minimum (strain UCR-PA7) TaxID=1286976 RepID=R8BP26_PHAM7|nr:hypothetical protein UCRPA7_3362 [Phaeoacremonium minimum UCRPA7]EOO01092.1 hypothetical protein UCRPA7_3362 [Phaeoacremonium minimum UCRPA7]
MASKAAEWDPLPFKEIFTSQSFQFLVGPEKRKFMLHKEILARLSPALDALLNGSMREATEGVVEWDDLDEDTFVRFGQYAYTGEYDAAEPDILLNCDAVASNETTSGATQDQQAPAQPITISSDDENVTDAMFVDEDNHDDSDHSESDGHISDDENASFNQDHSESDSDDSDDSDSSSDTDGRKPLLYPPYQEPPKLAAAFSFEGFITWADANCPGEFECEMAKEDIQPALPVYKKRKLDAYLDPSEDKHALDCPMQTKKYKLMHEFRKACEAVSGDDTKFKPRENKEPYESYDRVFMSHATLYVLADKYSIPALGKKTRARLMRTLYHFKVFDERIPDIVALVRYCYANTTSSDPLRKALTLYVSCIVDDIGDHQEFRDLLVEVGEFSADLALAMMKRID